MYLVAGSVVDSSSWNECIIQVEENGINALKVLTLITVMQWERGDSCFHDALHGALRITF